MSKPGRTTAAPASRAPVARAAVTGAAVIGATALPLLAASVGLPAPADAAVSALVAGGLPLAWAAAVAVAGGQRSLVGIALATALPFSAYALAAYAAVPSLAWFLALASAAGSAALACALSPRATKGATRGKDAGPGRRELALRLLLGAGPGLAAAALGSPLGSLGLSALAASIALLSATRKPR